MFTIAGTLTPTVVSQEVQDYGLALMNIPPHWNKTRGYGVGVVVMSSGVDAAHPDLAANVELAVDFTSSLDGATDTLGYGTHLAGVIAAVDNNIGVIGVAPRCNIFSLKVFDTTTDAQEGPILKALTWVLRNYRRYNLQVVCLGFSNTESNEKIKRAMFWLKRLGLIVVCPAGDGEDLDLSESSVEYPAAYTVDGLCFSIGAIGPDYQRLVTSATGTAMLDFVGPGKDVISCTPGNTYSKMSSTAVAAAGIAGLIALLLAYRSSKLKIDLDRDRIVSFEEVYDWLRITARDLGVRQYDFQYGWGVPVWSS